MITLSDQTFTSLPLDGDYKKMNTIIVEGLVVVETEADYLHRIDELSRYLGLEVTMLFPSGLYPINEFIQKINNKEIGFKTFYFKEGINDENFVPKEKVHYQAGEVCEEVIIDLDLYSDVSIIPTCPTYIIFENLRAGQKGSVKIKHQENSYIRIDSYDMSIYYSEGTVDEYYQLALSNEETIDILHYEVFEDGIFLDLRKNFYTAGRG